MRFVSYFFFLLFNFHMVKACLSLRYLHPHPGLVQTRPSPPGFPRNCCKHWSDDSSPSLCRKMCSASFAWQIDSCHNPVFLMSSSRHKLALIAKLISSRSRIHAHLPGSEALISPIGHAASQLLICIFCVVSKIS